MGMAVVYASTCGSVSARAFRRAVQHTIFRSAELCDHSFCYVFHSDSCNHRWRCPGSTGRRMGGSGAVRHTVNESRLLFAVSDRLYCDATMVRLRCHSLWPMRQSLVSLLATCILIGANVRICWIRVALDGAGLSVCGRSATGD